MTLSFFEIDKMRAAIRRQEFAPYFQPQICSRTLRISGVEILARWVKPGAILLPGQFLPAAEALGLMVEIDLSLYSQAEEILASMRDRGIGIPRHSFNVTANGLRDQRVVAFFQEMVVDPNKVSIEILESIALEEPDEGIQTAISSLRELGYQLEIDDFGSMHASLLAFIRVQPDRIKLDGRLVSAAVQGERFVNVLRVAINLAHSWGIEVVAEGVETVEQVDVLTKLGCDHLQGFYFLPPVDEGAFEAAVDEIGTV